jgi:CRISPR-associated protein Cmr4
MKTLILGLLAETSIHPGADQSSGFVDLPVAREAATDYPVIPGSSLKGALLSRAREQKMADLKRIFGEADNAGALLVSDARLLLLPVRSLSSAYKWVTCPHLLERYTRDKQRADHEAAKTMFPDIACGKYLGADNTTDKNTLFLEERQFERAEGFPDVLVEAIKPLICHKSTLDRLAKQLVVLHDDDFVWFARYGLAIQARNVLNESTKTSENLWYEETIPADALFYTLLAERQAGALDAATKLFDHHSYLQVGGNETVGMGWFAVALPTQKGAA